MHFYVSLYRKCVLLFSFGVALSIVFVQIVISFSLHLEPLGKDEGILPQPDMVSTHQNNSPNKHELQKEKSPTDHSPKQSSVGARAWESEYPYNLTCPGQQLLKANYSVVLGYHIGQMRNWENIVRDQLRTISVCGLGGSIIDEMFVSYSGSPRYPVNLPVIQEVWSDYESEIQVQPQWIESSGLPWEGTVMNSLIETCQQRQGETYPTVVFYLHTKGSSRYKDYWRNQMNEPYTYSRVLYWRKFMEYFTIERPSHCIHAIVNKGALACGVDRRSSGIYAGNFWAASCEYVANLPSITIVRPQGMSNAEKKDHYFEMETNFGQYQNPETPERYVSFFQPPSDQKGFYYRLIQPDEFHGTISNWGPLV